MRLRTRFFLHTDVQLFHYYLLWTLYFIYWIAFYHQGEKNNRPPMYSFVLLIYLSILLPISHYTDYSSFIVSLKIRHCESSKFFPLQKYFGYSKYLYLFVYTCEIVHKISCGILNRIALNLQICLRELIA